MKTVIIVDGTNMLIRNHFAYPNLTTASGKIPTGATYGMVTRIREAIQRFGPAMVYVAWDAGRAPWRQKLYPEYKLRSPAEHSPEFVRCFQQKSWVAALLTTMGIDQYSVAGVEADDLLAWLSLVRHADRHVVLLTSDRDFYQLVSDRIEVWYGVVDPNVDPKKNVTLATFREGKAEFERGMTFESPMHWHTYRIANGDASDHIRRVKGLSGKVKFPKVYGMLRSAGYHDDPLDFFVIRTPRFPIVTRDKIVKAMRSGWQDLRRNTLLMDLGFACQMLPREKALEAGLLAGAWDAKVFERMCAYLNFASVLGSMTAWVADLEQTWRARGA